MHRRTKELTLLFKRAKKYPKADDFVGRLAQMDRALVSGTKGRGFNSRIAHHFGLILFRGVREIL